MYEQIYKSHFASAQLAVICLARCPAASPDGDCGNVEKVLEERVTNINSQDSCMYLGGFNIVTAHVVQFNFLKKHLGQLGALFF